MVKRRIKRGIDDTVRFPVFYRAVKDFTAAIEMYASGLSLQQVANYYGMSRQSLWECFKRRGVAMRPQVRSGQENHFTRSKHWNNDRASDIVEVAIRNGIIVPQPCELCGKKAVAHHDDYNRPLDVRWLCRKHHWHWHKHNEPVALVAPLPVKSRSEAAQIAGKAGAAARWGKKNNV